MASMEQIKKLRDMTQAGVMDAKKALEENDNDIEKATQWLREKGIAKAAKKASAIATEGVIKVINNQERAMLIEINSQTDFVAMSDTFIQLSNEITEAIFKANIADLDKALQTKTISGISVAEACIQLTSKIGEKTSVRRFVFVHKQNNEVFAHYVHSNNKIGVLLVLSANANPIVGKNVAMHAAAMAPKFLNKTQVDQTWLTNETKILKEQTIAEGKPLPRIDHIVQGRVNKLLAEVCLEDQVYVKDPSKTISQYLAANNVKVTQYVRYEVGEGIEKKLTNFASEVAEQMRNK